MTIDQIKELAGHRDVSPWVIKLVQDAVEIEREALAEQEKQEPVAFISKGGLEELKREGKTDVFAECDYECVGTLPLYIAPVSAPKQEPVAWTRKRFGEDREYCESPFTTDWTPLYAAPVDAKDIRAEALEEAAIAGGAAAMAGLDFIEVAAAIRGLK
jgi:hypothetical protein